MTHALSWAVGTLIGIVLGLAHALATLLWRAVGRLANYPAALVSTRTSAALTAGPQVQRHPPSAAASRTQRLALGTLWGAKKLLLEVERGRLMDRSAVEERLLRVAPSPLSLPRWILGGQLFVEALYPRLHAALAAMVNAARDRALAAEIARVVSEIDAEISQGSHAEALAAAQLDLLRQAAGSRHSTWRPADDGITCIVLPPDAHGTPSQELDDLLLTDAGLYVVEVKGWKHIEPDGGHRTTDGSLLPPAHRQSASKVKRLQALLGPSVPVHSVVVLPNLCPAAMPLELDTRYLTGAADLGLMLRQHIQARARKDGAPIDFAEVRHALLAKMDRRPDAKIHHMLWLAENFPGDGTARVRDLYSRLQELRSQQGLIQPPAVAVRPTGVVLASAVPFAVAIAASRWIT